MATTIEGGLVLQTHSFKHSTPHSLYNEAFRSHPNNGLLTELENRTEYAPNSANCTLCRGAVDLLFQYSLLVPPSALTLFLPSDLHLLPVQLEQKLASLLPEVQQLEQIQLRIKLEHIQANI